MKYLIPAAFFFLINPLSGAKTIDDETTAIKNVITSSYLIPLFIDGDAETIKEGFHEEFRMYILTEGELSILTRDEWIKKIKDNKKKKKSQVNYSWKFELIDIDNQTAVVKLRINADQEVRYIDYLTLYKFSDGWKVITKQFTSYP
jgi:hypothetical protein